MDTFERYGSLLIGEMKLSEHLLIKKSETLQGFVNLGPFTQPEDTRLPCDHGMVVMFVPVTGKTSQIIGVFAAQKNVKSNLSKVLVEATIPAELEGPFANCATWDDATWNRKNMKINGHSRNRK